MKRFLSLVAAFAAAACSPVAPSITPQRAFVSSPNTSGSPIKHVVFIVQENRSFNNLFMGFPGATTANFGFDNKGNKIKLLPNDLSTKWDVGHGSAAFFAACDGTGSVPGTDCKMDGWNQEGTLPSAPANAAYSYVPKSETAPYWTMAKQYVLADNTFASNLDGSFVAHQYIVAAYAKSTVDFPVGQVWGCAGGKTDTVGTITKKRTYGKSIQACFNIPTIAAEADAAKLSWRFYTGEIEGDGGLWSSYQADRPIFNSKDWSTDVINPPSQFLTDVGKGNLAAITWITPLDESSDHPGFNASKGPAWIASVVDAIGTSSFWDSTAIFIFWDDWGGMFDPVKPPYEDYDGLGLRVPLIAISPYARQGYVTHVQYETASVLRYMEDNFGLAPLAAADTRAADPASDVFDYNQKARKFRKISGSEPAAYWRALQLQRVHGPPRHIIGDD
ncbi:MAG TPA: alkaline phosphatase family protein [Candidatus Cybelea sp.]|jgi:phospholipase C|nr:alkaline phosphatase family protein [Candidatus Cybelea sp.]